MTKILIVEDESAISMALKDDFEMEGYGVETAADGTEGLKRAQDPGFDLLILDVMLPGMNGFDICKKIRGQGINTPIIMLTARGQEIDRILGLEFGADDYITKPYSSRELLARVKAILRRIDYSSKISEDELFCIMGVEIDFRKHACRKNGRELNLTVYEYGLLQYLVRNRGRAISRDELLDEIWGKDIEVTPRVVDTHIANLRKKLEDRPFKPRIILGVHGFGYRFADL